MSKFIGIAITTVFTASLALHSEEARASQDEKRVLIHPFNATTNNEASDLLYLNADGIARQEQSIESILRQSGLSDSIQVRKSQGKSFNLLSGSLIESEKIHFSVDGFPLCRFEIKAHKTFNGSLTVLGSLPTVEATRSYTIADWPSVEDSLAAAVNSEYNPSPFGAAASTAHESCLWIDEGELVPVWKMTIKFGELLYTAIVDESHVYEFMPQHFHAEGKATIYPNNVLDAAKEEFTLTGLEDTGRLESDNFVTLLETATYDYAYASDFNFVFEDNTSEFIETSVFTNAHRSLEWLESMGYENFGSSPIRLIVHASFAGDTNNALYQPSSSYSMIYVGDGDGVVLSNLSTDSDVISHELGHHVVYHTIKNISGESLVVHEALADFLTYSRTGDSCLGESICPETSSICGVPQQCLRTADNDLSLTSDDLPPEPHLKSQFLSGLLWDLRTEDGIPGDDLTKMMISAIDLFVQDSGYQHVILGLMIIDDLEYEGQYCEKIYNRAITRGMQEQLEDFACSSISDYSDSPGTFIEDPSDSSSGSTTTTPVAQSKSRSSSSPLCGSVGASGSSPISLVIMVLLPAVVWLRRFF